MSLSKMVQIFLLGPVLPPAVQEHTSFSFTPQSMPHQDDLSCAVQQLVLPTQEPFPFGIRTIGTATGRRRHGKFLEKRCEGTPIPAPLNYIASHWGFKEGKAAP